MRSGPLRFFNFRLWVFGALASNVASWLQRTAQDWLVLTQLTHHSGAATGTTVGLQMLPMLLFSPYAGVLADRISRRLMVIVAQAIMGSAGLIMAILLFTHTVQLWEAWGCAFLVGVGSSIDLPSRQAMLPEIVPREDIARAVGLMGTAENIARMLGPALAGGLIAAFGTGVSFSCSAVCFAVMFLNVLALRTSELLPAPPREVMTSVLEGLRAGVRYVSTRPDLILIMATMGLISCLTFNNALNIALMSTTVFHRGAGEYGALSVVLALGGVCASLRRSKRPYPPLQLIGLSALSLGFADAVNALMPLFPLYAISLFGIGYTMMLFMNWTTVAVQLASNPAMHGRVFALFMAVEWGTTPLGSPLVGWIGQTAGARFSLLAGAGAAGVASVAYYLVASRGTRAVKLYNESIERYGLVSATDAPVGSETVGTEETLVAEGIA